MFSAHYLFIYLKDHEAIGY